MKVSHDFSFFSADGNSRRLEHVDKDNNEEQETQPT
tara:strand:- start:1214 stop:1321 length:108 start_codon:yes stop_codon:yes gene_type:complete